MKKVLLFSSALAVSSLVFSQSTMTTRTRTGAASPVAFGLKAGVNLSQYESEVVTNTENRTGYHVGALAHIHLSPVIALQPEVVYSSQGSKITNIGEDKLNYVNIPVLVQYMTESGFRVETGPQVGFVTSAKNKSVSGVEGDFKSQVQSTDFSWAFGVGYLTHSGFGLDARYNLGITDISKVNYKLKNRVWQFGVFYQFHH